MPWQEVLCNPVAVAGQLSLLLQDLLCNPVEMVARTAYPCSCDRACCIILLLWQDLLHPPAALAGLIA